MGPVVSPKLLLESSRNVMVHGEVKGKLVNAVRSQNVLCGIRSEAPPSPSRICIYAITGQLRAGTTCPAHRAVVFVVKRYMLSCYVN
jgi:hypothetical protein